MNANDTAIQKSNPRTIDVSGQTTRRGSWTYRPNVDIFNTADEVILIADLPGARADDIDVSVESGILTIQARTQPRTTGRRRTVMQEYGVGDFHRRFEINDTIDPESLSASYENGALTVHLPKSPRAQRRRIPVNAAN